MRGGIAGGADWMERRQVSLYVLAIGIGAALGLLLPRSAGPAAALIDPALGALLTATFLGVPFARLGGALRDGRFIASLLILNFVIVPAVAWLLTRLIDGDPGLLIGALFVLLAPCVDYVIVFTGLAGGAQDRLLAATPILMLAQVLLLPLSFWAFAGAELAASIDPAPFVRSFALLILLPLAIAALTQWLARRYRAAQVCAITVQRAMVPLMMVTLAAVVASQISAVGARIDELLPLIPVYLLFAAVMLLLGTVMARLQRLPSATGRALAFSGATRNSLVVLPLVLALPGAYALAPLAVVTQTLVELLVMLVMVRLVPLLIPDR